VSVNLKRIYIRNFETIKETTVDFPASGLCLVIGMNRTKSSVDSIGSGKTALGEAVSRTLLGVRGRYKGAKLGAYSSDHCGNKNTLIELTAELNGKELKVWSAYRCKDFSATGEALRFSYDGTTTERGSIDETREQLNKLIGTKSTVAENTVFVDGARLNFNDMSETELVDLFLSSLSSTDWTTAQRKTKATLDETEDEYQNLNGQFEASNRILSQAKDELAELEESLPAIAKRIEQLKSDQQTRVSNAAKKVEDAKKVVEKTKSRMAATKVDLKKLEKTKAEEFAKNELELSRARSDISTVTRDVDALNRVVGSAKKALSTARSTRDSLEEPTTCPTCGKPWDKKHGETALAKADDDIKKKSDELTKLQAELSAIEKKRDRMETDFRQLQTQLRSSAVSSQISELSESYEDDEKQLEDQNDSLTSAERQLSRESSAVDETPLRVVNEKIKSAKTRIEKLQTEIDGHAAKATELSTTLAVLTYWHKAFGPTGLPNMILGDAMSYVNHVSANVSGILTGGLLEINYANTKTLASAAERPELTINVKNATGATKFLGSSKGEAGISNLIIAETLNEIGRIWHRVGYRWLDEAVNSQDRMIRGAVYGYMREQANRRGILTFVVDHNQDVESHADHILIAEKSKEGFTTYRWASTI
jgi:DNA repair exonuclease SbcCD ATPase subunit